MSLCIYTYITHWMNIWKHIPVYGMNLYLIMFFRLYELFLNCLIPRRNCTAIYYKIIFSPYPSWYFLLAITVTVFYFSLRCYEKVNGRGKNPWTQKGQQDFTQAIEFLYRAIAKRRTS